MICSMFRCPKFSNAPNNTVPCECLPGYYQLNDAPLVCVKSCPKDMTIVTTINSNINIC